MRVISRWGLGFLRGWGSFGKKSVSLFFRVRGVEFVDLVFEGLGAKRGKVRGSFLDVVFFLIASIFWDSFCCVLRVFVWVFVVLVGVGWMKFIRIGCCFFFYWFRFCLVWLFSFSSFVVCGCCFFGYMFEVYFSVVFLGFGFG